MPLPLWVPEPKTKDYWKTVADLRAPSTEGLKLYVSERSSAAHLEDFEH
jgi:hypothetical protein